MRTARRRAVACEKPVRTGSERIGDWIRKQLQTMMPGSGNGSVPVHKTRSDTSEYRLLHKYLRDRFANRLVLSFSEIEDILGFALPESARLQEEWWATGTAAHESVQSDSWTLASRTATVNMAAQNVMFERETPAEASRRR